MLKPHYIMKSVTDITVDFLKGENINALLLDVDNTLSIAHADKTLRQGVDKWLCEMKNGGIILMILSNAKTNRAKLFADSIGLPVVSMAGKPLPFGYIKATKIMKVKRKNAAIVGDQVFTDVLGGKLSGVRTILVTDITPENQTFFKIKRFFERIMLKRWQNEC